MESISAWHRVSLLELIETLGLLLRQQLHHKNNDINNYRTEQASEPTGLCEEESSGINRMNV
jgi:hypothetical protein